MSLQGSLGLREPIIFIQWARRELDVVMGSLVFLLEDRAAGNATSVVITGMSSSRTGYAARRRRARRGDRVSTFSLNPDLK
jgi:hypothetical protein